MTASDSTVAKTGRRMQSSEIFMRPNPLACSASWRVPPCRCYHRRRPVWRRPARPRPSGRLTQFLTAAGIRARTSESFRDEQVLPPERLEAALRSFSLVGPALAPDRLAAMLAAARALADGAGGATWTREVRLTWGRRP